MFFLASGRNPGSGAWVKRVPRGARRDFSGRENLLFGHSILNDLRSISPPTFSGLRLYSGAPQAKKTSNTGYFSKRTQAKKTSNTGYFWNRKIVIFSTKIVVYGKHLTLRRPSFFVNPDNVGRDRAPTEGFRTPSFNAHVRRATPHVWLMRT